MLFDSWTALGRIALTGVLIYVAVVLLLRLTGKRTLAKWNAFDFIVTVALGSTLATAVLAKQTALVEGILALGLLMVLQYAATWLSVRSGSVRHLLKSQPTLLLYEGRFRHHVMRQERVTESEVRAALRAHGIASVQRATAVVLETDGTFTVIEDLGTDEPSALTDVAGFEEARSAQPAPR